jgi:hypothetical protein
LSLTEYQAKYFAHELTRRFPPDSVEKITVAFAGAQVDLNPHQIDAALFAFKSPLSRGALLADEVGLGKTIEAGLVLSQKWAERKRRILVITPSNLRKQWYQELTEKFFLPCRLLEIKSYNAACKQGALRPFESPEIIICSYHFAKNKAKDVQAVPWDLVVIDEAHRLRNVYKSSNVIANTLKIVLAGKDKLFTYAPSDAIYWQHGHSTEQDFIYVTTAGLTHDQLQQLSDEVGSERSLLVLCTAFRARADRFPNLTVKKIPRAVLARCEWGHDDYSLRVENLPQAPPPKGQMDLFGEEPD